MSKTEVLFIELNKKALKIISLLIVLNNKPFIQFCLKITNNILRNGVKNILRNLKQIRPNLPIAGSFYFE
jgi:hypothetical protein